MTKPRVTKEPQYELLFEVEKKHGISKLGLMANESWNQDPKRTLFTLARYKFIAKMLTGYNQVLEVGCADAFGTRLVQQSVKHVTAIDYDPIFIQDAINRGNPNWPLTLLVHDMLEGPILGSYDALFSLDVLEHIDPKSETKFIENMISSLKPNGVAIIGMPSIESQVHASPQSKSGHINCKSGSHLRETFQRYFHNVFLFSMNDEVLHTGYAPMAHYILVLCSGKMSL
jgi:2-polyprenyl-3-methyl-5-hydroxy-6-metoxy-1,4-benzoquinol methylase